MGLENVLHLPFLKTQNFPLDSGSITAPPSAGGRRGVTGLDMQAIVRESSLCSLPLPLPHFASGSRRCPGREPTLRLPPGEPPLFPVEPRRGGACPSRTPTEKARPREVLAPPLRRSGISRACSPFLSFRDRSADRSWESVPSAPCSSPPGRGSPVAHTGEVRGRPPPPQARNPTLQNPPHEGTMELLSISVTNYSIYRRTSP